MTCWVQMNKIGSNVQKTGVTPAEVVVLRALHQNEAGRDPISEPTEVKEVERTNKEEVLRLKNIYGGARMDGGKVTVMDKLYPGDTPTLPQKFSEVDVKVAITEPVKAAPTTSAAAAK